MATGVGVRWEPGLNSVLFENRTEMNPWFYTARVPQRTRKSARSSDQSTCGRSCVLVHTYNVHTDMCMCVRAHTHTHARTSGEIVAHADFLLSPKTRGRLAAAIPGHKANSNPEGPRRLRVVTKSPVSRARLLVLYGLFILLLLLSLTFGLFFLF